MDIAEANITLSIENMPIKVTAAFEVVADPDGTGYDLNSLIIDGTDIDLLELVEVNDDFERQVYSLCYDYFTEES